MIDSDLAGPKVRRRSLEIADRLDVRALYLRDAPIEPGTKQRHRVAGKTKTACVTLRVFVIEARVASERLPNPDELIESAERIRAVLAC